jgi:cytochrome c-type biogenesis protein
MIMFETITKFASYLENVTFLTYPITMFLGFLSGITALTCLLPLVPAIAGFIGIQQCTRRRLFTVPFLIMLGSMVTLVILGVVVSLAGITLQKSLGQYWSYLIGAVCIIVGLFVLGVIKISTKIKIPKIKQAGVIAPFLFGLCIGGVMGFGSACCLPVLPIILTYAAIKGRPLHGALIMVAFAIGQSIPLFAIGLFSNVLGKFANKWSGYIRRIAGVLLLISGIYFIWRG